MSKTEMRHSIKLKLEQQQELEKQQKLKKQQEQKDQQEKLEKEIQALQKQIEEDLEKRNNPRFEKLETTAKDHNSRIEKLENEVFGGGTKRKDGEEKSSPSAPHPEEIDGMPVIAMVPLVQAAYGIDSDGNTYTIDPKLAYVLEQHGFQVGMGAFLSTPDGKYQTSLTLGNLVDLGTVRVHS